MEHNVTIKKAAVMQRIETKSQHHSFRAAKRQRKKNSWPWNTFAPFCNNSLLVPSLWRTWLDIFRVSLSYLSQVMSFDSSNPALITALWLKEQSCPPFQVFVSDLGGVASSQKCLFTSAHFLLGRESYSKTCLSPDFPPPPVFLMPLSSWLQGLLDHGDKLLCVFAEPILGCARLALKICILLPFQLQLHGHHICFVHGQTLPSRCKCFSPSSIWHLNVPIFPLTTVKGDKNNFNVAVKFSLLFKNREWTAIASQIITCMETRHPVTCWLITN